VLKQVNPSYALRMAGMAVATTTLISFWVLGVVMLLRQEKELSRLEILRQLRAIRQREPILTRVFLRGLREYIKRDFHPWQRDNLAIARQILAEVEGAAA
jgi:predicted metal-dependent hydrolase